jgi:hypothetical protein
MTPSRIAFLDTLLDGRDELARDRAADYRVLELEAEPRGSGETSILASPNCPRPPVCFL